MIDDVNDFLYSQLKSFILVKLILFELLDDTLLYKYEATRQFSLRRFNTDKQKANFNKYRKGRSIQLWFESILPCSKKYTFFL
jgi:hypothetical protein